MADNIAKLNSAIDNLETVMNDYHDPRSEIGRLAADAADTAEEAKELIVEEMDDDG